jgi:tetratricopeptide (TPR) repeat protein
MLKQSRVGAAALLAGGAIVLAALAVYGNTFTRPFIFDDLWSIVNNPTLHHFGTALSPPLNEGVGGRPLLSLSFFFNYVISGDQVWSYHVLNLVVHILAALTLFGVMWRTLEFAGVGTLGFGEVKTPGFVEVGARGPRVRAGAQAKADMDGVRAEAESKAGADGRAARPYLLAFVIAVLWAVHPVQTEAVTYISQRAEAMMGLFYLLTLYGFIRSVESPATGSRAAIPGAPGATRRWFSPVHWQILSILAGLLGALSKESISTAPLMVFLYDRTFAAGSFREAWRRRWGYYLGLGGVWLLLAGLLSGLHQRGLGFGEGVSVWHYALTSCRSLVLYLKLAIWPHPLVIDYGNHLVSHAADALPCALVLAVLLAAVAAALRYRPALGFAGVWFFLILAPTTSILPVPGQPAAEHRVYLSLAAVIALLVVGLYFWMGRRSLILFAALAVGLGGMTVRRNADYRDPLAIWSDTAAKRPENERAHNGLGYVLMDLPGRRADAIAEFETAVRIKPDYAEAHFNLGNALLKVPDRTQEALAEYETAARIKPDYAEAYDSVGNILAGLPGHLPDAVAEYQTALRIKPDYAEAHNNLGAALIKFRGHLPDAIAEYETAVRLKPDYVQAHFNLGTALSEVPGRVPDAIAEYETVVRLKPDYPEAQNNLGCLLAGQPGGLTEAIVHFEAAVRTQPDYAEAHLNLATALANTPGRLPDAISELDTALRLKPDLAPAREMLDRLRGSKNL